MSSSHPDVYLDSQDMALISDVLKVHGTVDGSAEIRTIEMRFLLTTFAEGKTTAEVLIRQLADFQQRNATETGGLRPQKSAIEGWENGRAI